MTSQREFDRWASDLRVAHPEMFKRQTVQSSRRLPARKKWHPLFLRVYGIHPWEMGNYTVREYGELVEGLKTHGVGVGF